MPLEERMNSDVATVSVCLVALTELTIELNFNETNSVRV